MSVSTELDWNIQSDRIIIGNVTIHWEDHGRWGEEFTGSTTCEFDVSVLQEYILFREDFSLPFDAKEDFDVNMFRPDDTFETTNTDFAICLMAFLIGEDRQATISVRCDHIFWAVHDILHAEKDFNNGSYDDAYISSHVERDRHLEAFRLCVENNVIHNDDLELFERICTEQSARSRHGATARLTLDELLDYAKENLDEFDESVFVNWTENYLEPEEEEYELKEDY